MNIIGQKILLFTLVLIIIQGCSYSETVDNRIVVRPSDPYKFELEISVHTSGRGNIHNLDVKKYDYDKSDWIYSNTISGKVVASEIILTDHHKKFKYPWTRGGLKGYIEFSSDSVLINLEVPRYLDNDSVQERWIAYEYNGKYIIEKNAP